MVPKRSSVSFTELRQFLVGLGFTPSKRGKFWCFEHALSGTRFLYRPYRPRERVTLLDLHITRQDLDWHDILEEQEFDDRLSKASA